ncbi:unnamed protein product [Brachionus calyciflorus]|uniref:PLAT domain-containing protein n=1 Tax=Brachionus calyciflorus TaxID=104777 RepID=A0A813UNU5_9BILA|nr:unnamed protein product [Brachionus calyciflorus]
MSIDVFPDLKMVSFIFSLINQNSSEVEINSLSKINTKLSDLSENLLDFSKTIKFDQIVQGMEKICDNYGFVIKGFSNLGNKSEDVERAKGSINTFENLLNNFGIIASNQLKINDEIQIKTNSFDLNLERFTKGQINKTNALLVDYPDNFLDIFNKSNNETILKKAVFSKYTLIGAIDNEILNLQNSSQLTLSFVDEFKQQEFRIENLTEPFVFKIPRNLSEKIFDFINVTNYNSSYDVDNRFLTLSFSTNNKSIISFYLKPKNISMAYLIAVKFGSKPILTDKTHDFDYFYSLCPDNLKQLENESVYFIQLNQSMINYTDNNLIGIGISELTNKSLCHIESEEILNKTRYVTCDFNVLFFESNCYYLNRFTGEWLSDGLVVGENINLNCTECLAYHLTDITAGVSILPAKIDFNYVFKSSSFEKNSTIYITLIVIGSIYIILFVWTRIMDRKDNLKTKIYFLNDNIDDHNNLYEIIVFTGNRKSAGCKSNVFFDLYGNLGQENNRQLNSSLNKNYVLQRGSINTFIMKTKNTLGDLNFLRIWHDNSGGDWYLKHVIINDFSNGNTFFFICNKWLSLTKEDEQIQRLLPLAGDEQKKELIYLLQKEVKNKLSDGHLWFSIFAKSSLNSFKRTERLTCCFVLMLLGAMANILYYEQDTTVNTSELKFGPFSLSASQIVIGIMTNLITFPPSFLLVHLFRLSKARKPRSDVLKKMIKKSKEDKELIDLKHCDNQNKINSNFSNKYTDMNLSSTFTKDDDLQNIRQRLKKDNKAKAALIEIILYFMFACISFIVCYSKIDVKSFIYKSMVLNFFQLNDQSSFYKIQKPNDVYTWISNEFLPKIQSNSYYNNQKTNLYNYIRDHNSILIGNVILRQLRIKTEKCTQINDRTCFRDYSIFNEEKSNFKPNWIFNYTNESYTSIIEESFMYKHSSDMESYPYLGLYTTYMGGGYVYEINQKKNIDYVQKDILFLNKLNWINGNTRALFIEFSLFNPNVNYFSYNTILFEFLSTGHILKSININPFSLYNYETGFSILALICDIFYVLVGKIISMIL